MIKKITQFWVAASISLLMLFSFTPTLAHAQVTTDQISGNLCAGANLDASSLGSAASNSAASNCDGTLATERINDILKLVINIFSLIVGVVSVIMIIVGGLKYITSGGESGNITGAKNTILYAIIGLVVVALAQVVVKFVLAKATGTIQ